MMKPAIRLIDITKIFELFREKQTSLKSAILSFRRTPPQKLVAIKDLNLTVEHGETVAIIGRNGSGKSTTLRIIGRVYKPTAGSVEVDGRMSTMLDLGAGFHPDLTGRENIFFSAAVMGLSTAQIRDRIDRIIDFSELNDFIDSPIKTYSAGMLMRLGFAIAVETDPDILLIDEVLAVGDAAFQGKCYERIDSFKAAGRTIVFVTHDLEAARSVASRTIWFDKGEIRADGETREVIDAYLSTVPAHQHSA
ncbi:MAG: ABC transporter ATP-binding protein [Armatimonadota bacterium]